MADHLSSMGLPHLDPACGHPPSPADPSTYHMGSVVARGESHLTWALLDYGRACLSRCNMRRFIHLYTRYHGRAGTGRTLGGLLLPLLLICPCPWIPHTDPFAPSRHHSVPAWMTLSHLLTGNLRRLVASSSLRLRDKGDLYASLDISYQ